MILKMNRQRLDSEEPEAVGKWGWKYHHTGIPTDKIMPGEVYLPGFGIHVSGFRESPFGIEWMRYEEWSPLHELIKTVPHLAFEVGNIEEEIRKHNLSVIFEPGSPSDGVRSAMIEYDGAPVELIEFSGK
jgi:hypothetical protein